MRVLHAVTQRETLVASGVYRYTRVGETLHGEEHFSIHALPDGSWFVRIDYDWRLLDGTSQLIEALLDPRDAGGRFQRVVAQLQSPSGTAKETMDFHPTSVLVGISGVDGTRRDFELAQPEGYAVVLLKTTLVGLAAARWPVGEGVSVPAFCGYRSGDDTALAFPASLVTVGHEDVTIGSSTIHARVVELTGEFTQKLWLDDVTGVVLKRTSGELIVDLANYARGSRV